MEWDKRQLSRTPVNVETWLHFKQVMITRTTTTASAASTTSEGEFTCIAVLRRRARADPGSSQIATAACPAATKSSNGWSLPEEESSAFLDFWIKAFAMACVIRVPEILLR
ncbi:MAG: hypothetical protein IT521_02640 [Burkholderiales bacterium]|nr:hypothetical protein [Burkholderiales bacterium]